jgi:oligo-1,6-glucosidase
MITYESRVKEVYNTPLGKDMIDQLFLQMGMNESILKNPLVRNLKMKTVQKLAKDRIAEDFYPAFFDLINVESECYKAKEEKKEDARGWWKEEVFYQIYPRSFKDSNGDGIGDLVGIIDKLDYLKDLGVGCIWLSPIYDSPNDDNGYDIRDYKKIMEEFGSMRDFDRLLDNVHRRNMHLIMDLVVNHTSDEHEWFKKAISDPNSPEHDYYMFEKGNKDEVPNNWTSFFSGPAWNYYEELGEWGLHLFSKKQMDLNWDNPKVREEVAGICDWWLEKGVDGFRMDVGNLISKRQGLPDGNEMIGELIGIRGIENYIYGPNLNSYMKELRKKGFKSPEKFLVGETPGVGLEMAKYLTAPDREEMNMVFNFDQLENPGYQRFDTYDYDLNYYKKYMIHWMKNYTNDSRMSLFYDNHDNPRMLSKVTKDPKYRMIASKLLAVMQMTLKGTPFMYQGQEIAMVNMDFKSMDEIRDVESINKYNELLETMSEEEAFQVILAGTRDHARTPMPWTGEKYGGFSEYEPWIEGDDDYIENNVMEQICDVTSTLHFYKRLIDLRNDSLVFKYGDIRFVNEKKKDVFTYYRSPALSVNSCKNRMTYYIECNLSDQEIKRPKTKEGKKRLMSNYNKYNKEIMQPYEATIHIVD